MTASRPRRRRKPAPTLSAQIQAAADEQRRLIARRLHDTAQQSVAAAAMSLALLERQAPALSSAARETLAEAMRIMGVCSAELREISQLLHPSVLDRGGLLAALEALATRLGPDRVHIDAEAARRLQPEAETTVYRLIEEAALGFFAPDAPLHVTFRLPATGALSLRMDGSARVDRGEDLMVAALRERARAAGGQLVLRSPRRSRGSGRTWIARVEVDVREPPTLPPK